MRVLILTPEYTGYGGGIMTVYQHLERALVHAGCSVVVAEGSMWNSAPGGARHRTGDAEVLRLDSGRAARVYEELGHLAAVPTLRRHLAAAVALWDQAKESGDFDVIEGVDFGFLSLGPLLDGITPVNELHGSVGQIGLHDHQSDQSLDEILGLAIERELVRMAVPQTLSRANAEYWLSQAGKEVEVLRPAWTAQPDPGPALGAVAPSIAIFGRIQRWKGPHVVCQALRLMKTRVPPVHWYGRDMPCGELGPSTDAWLSNAFPQVWRRSVLPHAPVPPERVRAIQASAVVNLIPSTWDVFNLTAVESMASGRPTVCSDGAGASELIVGGVNGFVYRRDDPSSLAEALERALSLSDKAKQAMAEAASDTLALELDPKAIATARLATYETARRRPGPVSIPDWLRDLVRRDGRAGQHPLDFLDRLPLRDLMRYVGRRTFRRVSRGSI